MTRRELMGSGFASMVAATARAKRSEESSETCGPTSEETRIAEIDKLLGDIRKHLITARVYTFSAEWPIVHTGFIRATDGTLFPIKKLGPASWVNILMHHDEVEATK